jgi:DEAD/DEAH box helicase domain-containing protein
MPAADLIRQLSCNPKYRDHIAHIEEFPARDAVYGGPEGDLPDPLAAYLEKRRIRLYSHQSRMLDHIRRGRHTIITTPTASGKTLSFNLPIFERLMHDECATALYLYPTKALSNDQQKTIAEMEKWTGLGLNAAVYDGDTPQGRRPAIRERSRLVISNPYELHQILPWHHKWSRFLARLQFIVIDEAHRYRGIFGSHIAFLIRRLRRICEFYGAHPQFILSTATLANPREFAEKLTGLPFELVDEDGSPRGRKQFILFNPYAHGIKERSTHVFTKDLLVSCLDNGLQTLCFTTSRKMAELITQWSKRERHDPFHRSGEEIATYRAGYLPEERRGIEDRLKAGRIGGVVSTNALELGIDIGSLDAVIISGYPGTMMSTWQQAGRAGRRLDDSLAILVAFENPLDQYFMRHPASFFGRPHEHAVIDDRNPYIVSGHLLCAAAELPVYPDRDRTYFGEQSLMMLPSLEGHALMRKTLRGWVYSGKGRAADAVQLDGITSDTFRILCGGSLIETMGRSQAYREAHMGAVLLHQGEPYIVQEFDLDGRTIRVKETDADFYTQPMKSVDLHIRSELRTEECDGVRLSFGDVEVIEQYTGYKILKYDQVIGMESLDLPPLHFETKALWYTIPEESGRGIASRGMDFAGGLHGIEHAMIGVIPFYVMCDRWDIGGLSTRFYPGTAEPTVFIYDGFEGGVGLAEKAYQLIGEITATSHELVRDCACESGCPACIYSPKCGNDNQPLDKQATIVLLEALLGCWNKRSAHS